MESILPQRLEASIMLKHVCIECNIMYAPAQSLHMYMFRTDD